MIDGKMIAVVVTALFMVAVFFMIADNKIVLMAIAVAAIAFVVTRMKERTVLMGEI